jgi:hypothetical protein
MLYGVMRSRIDPVLIQNTITALNSRTITLMDEALVLDQKAVSEEKKPDVNIKREP